VTEPDQFPETTHFGLTRIGEGESFSKNGWAFTDLDRIRLDDLLFAVVNHKHDGSPALGDPTDPPDLLVSPTGGDLPAATTFFYRCSYIDDHGLETAASPETSVTTPDPLDAPTAPAATVETTGGAVEAGIYAYMLTFLDAYGGETTPSPMNDVRVETGSTNRVRLDLPALITGAASINVYRARPGQTTFFRVASAVTATTWYDVGDLEDQSITAPVANTTNAGNSVSVGAPLGFIPLGCKSWNIYRATFSGGYDGNSLVHNVIEGATDTSTIPRTTWIDTGDVLLQGFPQNSSATIPSPPVIDLGDVQGQLNLAVIPRGSQCVSSYGAGVLTNAQLLNATEVVTTLRPTRLTAYFHTPPETGVTVRFRVEDPYSNYIELACSDATAIGGDPSGYFRKAFPLTDGGEFQAENGTRSDPANIEVVTDLAAVSGQAVTIDAQNEWVQVSMGVLDPGSYTSSAKVRVLGYATGSTDDLVIEAVNLNTDTVLASTSYTPGDAGHPQTDAYVDYDGPSFTSPGAEIAIRVRKGTTSGQYYNVDSMLADVSGTILFGGTIKITAYVDSGPTVAADVNVALWF
jgi:hypothetical protein